MGCTIAENKGLRVNLGKDFDETINCERYHKVTGDKIRWTVHFKELHLEKLFGDGMRGIEIEVRASGPGNAKIEPVTNKYGHFNPHPGKNQVPGQSINNYPNGNTVDLLYTALA